jgi:NADH-quinone oxidoreductase subunit L
MLTAIVLLPLLGFILNGVLATRLGGNRVGKRFVTVVGCGLPIAAFFLVVKALLDLYAASDTPLIEVAYRWAQIGASRFEVAFYFDRLTAVMTLVVTGVGSVIHIYSVGYMKDDESYGRFFAYLNLFLFFMLLLVLGRSLLVLFVGWEGVGLCSYLLIGFWFHDPANARAGKKAFIVNRTASTARSAAPRLRRCRRASSACCCSSARPASRRRSRSTSGSRTRWPGRRRSRR